VVVERRGQDCLGLVLKVLNIYIFFFNLRVFIKE